MRSTHRPIGIIALVLSVLLPAVLTHAATLVVDQRHARAADTNPGTPDAPFKTINAAAQVAQPGDTVMVQTGVYRERVAPARGGEVGKPIVYTAAPGALVEIKGSNEFKPQWQPVQDHTGCYTGQFDPAVFRTGAPEGALQEYNPYTTKHQVVPNRTVGQIFVNGQRLLEMDSLDQVYASPGTWITDGKSVTVNFPAATPPQSALVELSVRYRIFAPYQRGLGYIHVKNFLMSHCANNGIEGFYDRGSQFPQTGALGTRAGHHWLIEGNIIRFATGVGVDIGGEGVSDSDGMNQPRGRGIGYHVVQYNTVSDHGAAGLVGSGTPMVRLIGNVFERNHYLGYRGLESAGVKLHSPNGGLFEGNLFRDNGTMGLWLDNGARNARVTRNVFMANQGAGMFMELGNGPTMIDNNVFAMTTQGDLFNGDGMYSHDASGITFAHNLMYFNAHYGLWSHIGRANEPDYGITSHWRIYNNLFVGNAVGAMSLPPEFGRSTDNFSDFNLIAAGHNRLTAESFSAEMDNPLFMVNTNKGLVDIKDLSTRLQVALDAANVPASQRPNLDLWPSVPFLTLTQWQALTGWDRHSRIPVFVRPVLMNADRVQFTFMIDDSPAQVGCKPIDGVTVDFHGRPIPATGPILAGPFQQLKFESALKNRTEFRTDYRGDFEKLRQVEPNRITVWPIEQPAIVAKTWNPPAPATMPAGRGGRGTTPPASAPAAAPAPAQ